MSFSPKIANEIARVMRDANALRSGGGPGGRGHYDPNQPRVPAGDPKGGQFAPKGYSGGNSGRDARVMLASLDGAQLAQLGQGNPLDAYAQVHPFEGLFGDVDAGEHLNSRRGFLESERDRNTNPRTQAAAFEAGPRGRYQFVSTRPFLHSPLSNGFRITLTATTYGHDSVTGAYVTIRATVARPIVIQEINGVVSIERS